MRANENLGEQQGDWWSGSSSMAASQVYPKTFGRAVSCLIMKLHLFIDRSTIQHLQYVAKVALILDLIRRDPAERAIRTLPLSIPRIARQLVAEEA